MLQSELRPQPVRSKELAEPFPEDSEISLLDHLIVYTENRRFIVRVVALTAVAATVIAFLLPIRYEGKIVLLPPAQNTSLGATLVGQLANGSLGGLGSLASLAGGSLGLKNPADMYVALLTSRTVEDGMVQRFRLMQEYHDKRMSDARKDLEHRTTVLAGPKDGLIRLSVEDPNPARAAELANGYVEEFRKLSASLAITEAARRRLFFEQQLEQAKDKLTDAENAMTQVQRSTGVLQMDSQARALIESAAVLRAQVAAKQVQIEGLRSFATEGNPELILAKQELAALEAQLAKVAGSASDPGSDINLSKGRVTEAGMEYLRHYRDLKYQETVYELLAKEFEIAKLDEAREGSIVQVVDAAVPPDRKSFPPRTLIVVGATLFSFFAALVYVSLRQRVRLASQLPENRQRVRILKGLWKSTSRKV